MHPIEAGVNYYRRYIGDFQADTMSLSMMEQGAYDRLLDHYYATERPIPLNSDRAAIICRAITIEERAAVQMILDYYFNRTAAGWEHLRVERRKSSFPRPAQTPQKSPGKGVPIADGMANMMANPMANKMATAIAREIARRIAREMALQPPTTNQIQTTLLRPLSRTTRRGLFVSGKHGRSRNESCGSSTPGKFGRGSTSTPSRKPSWLTSSRLATRSTGAMASTPCPRPTSTSGDGTTTWNRVPRGS
jgi:hypothetical protein